MDDDRLEFLGELRLGRTITTVGQAAAVGLAIWVGFTAVIPDQTIKLLGARVLIAVLLALLFLGLTIADVIELLGGSGERGGSYILVLETLGGLGAFLTGIAILTSCMALTAAMAQTAAQQILSRMSLAPLTEGTLAALLIFFLLIIQLFQIYSRRVHSSIIIFTLLILLGIILVSVLPDFSFSSFSSLHSPPPLNFDALNIAVVWFSIQYLAFEAILTSRRQIREPGKVMPASLMEVLGIGGFFALLLLTIILGLTPPTLIHNSQWIKQLSQLSLFPDWILFFLLVAVLLVSMNGCITIAARQIHLLSTAGAFPQILRHRWKLFPMPLLHYVLIGIIVFPLTIWIAAETLIDLTAVMTLLVIIAVNGAALYSRQVEPERRRPFKVPLFPLVPGLALVLSILMLRVISSKIALATGVVMLVGSFYYLLYARFQQVKAQEGEIIFGHVQHPEGKLPVWRVLVPIGPGEARTLILNIAATIAHQFHGELIPLQVIVVADPLAIEEGRKAAQERNLLFQWSTRVAEDFGVSVHPITRLARSVVEGIIDTASEEAIKLILLPWTVKNEGQEIRIGNVLRNVVNQAPCDVVAVAYQPGIWSEMDVPQSQEGQGLSNNHFKFSPKKILVPTSGGPNAPLAIRLALQLARAHDATVTTVYVTDLDAAPKDIQEGKQRIDNTIAVMRQQAQELLNHAETLEEIPIEGSVIKADNVVSGLIQTGDEYDLLLLGATEESIIDQMLFGSIPEQIARQSRTPVLIVKRYQGLPRLWLQRLWNALFDTLPTLTREEQIEVYRSIHREARPDVDFFIMIGLSTLIATFGLLQNSTAVIIGAMLVAPLFSPLIALSLAIIQGNIRLIRLAGESTLKGIALSISLSALLTLLVPFKPLTNEIMARTQPTLFDLAVALASGTAGAYAVARKDVAAALPGVAIAAALVPPLGVVGIGIALGSFSVTGGSFLLFLTNLVAIALAGSLTFLLLGFRPGGRGAREVHVRRGLATTLILFILISIPLGVYLFQSIRSSHTTQEIQAAVITAIQEYPSVELVSRDEIQVQSQNNQLIITVPLYVQGEISQNLANSLQADVQQAIHQSVTIRLVTYQTIQSSP